MYKYCVYISFHHKKYIYKIKYINVAFMCLNVTFTSHLSYHIMFKNTGRPESDLYAMVKPGHVGFN